MACFRCGAIMEYASSSFEKLKKEMAAQSGFQIRVVRLEVAECAANAGSPRTSVFLYRVSCDSVATEFTRENRARLGFLEQHGTVCANAIANSKGCRSVSKARISGIFLCSAICMFVSINVWAGAGGSVSGTVKDASGAVIADATVNATNVETGVHDRVATNGRGFYSFPGLPVGRYNIAIKKTGFKVYQRTEILINTNSALTVDVVLDVGETFDAVTVIDTAVHVETSDTQMGDVIGAGKMAAVPLNGRSYTDLLALQPGVVPATSLTSNTQQDVGVSALSPSGSLNPGTISINGQREFANAFTVNGSDAEEDVNSGTAIIPNLDSIAEFRILTSSFDAEYGGHSGGQINVVPNRARMRFTATGSSSSAIRTSTPAIIFLRRAGRMIKTSLAEPSAARFAETKRFSLPIIKGRASPREWTRADSGSNVGRADGNFTDRQRADGSVSGSIGRFAIREAWIIGFPASVITCRDARAAQ